MPAKPIKRLRNNNPAVKIPATVSNNTLPSLPTKRLCNDTLETRATLPTKINGTRATAQEAHFARPRARPIKSVYDKVETFFGDMIQHHLKTHAFESPRDILLYLATDNQFRLLPKMLHRLDSYLGRIEQSYRANPYAVLSLPLPGSKRNTIVTPTITSKLLALYNLFCRTDRCLMAYVLRRRRPRGDTNNMKTLAVAAAKRQKLDSK